MGADLAGGTLEGIAIGVLQVVLEVLFCEGGDVLACVFAEEGEGVGGHFGGRGREGNVLGGGFNGGTSEGDCSLRRKEGKEGIEVFRG